MNAGTKAYVQVEDPEAQKRVDKLRAFIEENGYGFYIVSERIEGQNKFVMISVDIKVTADKSSRMGQVMKV